MTKSSEFAHRLKEIYAGEPWFGESIQAKLKNLTSDRAFQQPLPGEHSIAELVSHMEFWSRSFLFHLRGDKSISFTADHPENWQSIEVLKKTGWEKLCSSFNETQQALVSELQKNSVLTDEQVVYLNGIIEHTIYHLGQIGIVKKLVLNSELV